MKITYEMVEAACAVFVRAYEPDRVPHSSDLIRSAIEAALAAAPACPHIRSSGPPERATNWCALAAAPRPLLTVSELQQALVDVGLIYPEAIDDAEGFDDYVTLERIDELHKMLTQAAKPSNNGALRAALGDER